MNFCALCGKVGDHTAANCPWANRGIIMLKAAFIVLLLAGTTALVAQDAELTPEQQAAKCAAEGGCALFTRDAFMQIIRAASEAAFRQGLQSCNKST